MELLESLEPLHRAFWYVALPTSLVFLIQTVLTFLGGDATHGGSTDISGDGHAADGPFQLFSLRNLINFLLGFSWTGISFYSVIPNGPLLITVSFGVGVLFVYLFFLVIIQLQKLAEDNSFRMANTLNKTAEVYLTIPENKQGKGKVMISVNGSFHELEAMTEHHKILSGSVVRIVRIQDNVLIVEPV